LHSTASINWTTKLLRLSYIHFFFLLDILHQSINEKFIIIAYDDGTKENVNVFEIKNLPDENQKCKINICCDKVSDFRNVSEKHFKDQKELRFPPAYYLGEGITKDFGDELEELNLSPTTRILTEYNPINHLKMLGFTDKHFDDNLISTNSTFQNVLTVLVPEKSLILIFVIVETKGSKEIKSGVQMCNNILKTVNAAIQKTVSNQIVTIVGTIVLPAISKNELNASKFPFLNLTQEEQTNNKCFHFVTKEQFESLGGWWNDLHCYLSAVQTSRQSSNNNQIIETIAGEMVTSMCIIHSFLPKVTSKTDEKIVTLLLNQNQIGVILNTAYWKVISGHFGSGKSVCLKEIAKRIYCKNDGSTIFYVCFDPYSLLETEITQYFETISNDGRLQSLSISEISSQAGFSVEQFCNQLGPPEKNIADLFEYLQKTYGKCHLLVDEFQTDNITPRYCERLKQSLNNKFKDSTLVIATQSITTTKRLINKGKEVNEYETCSLENAGMEILKPLLKAMRVPSNIFDLTETAIDCITERETMLSIPSVELEDEVTTKSRIKASRKLSENSQIISDENSLKERSDEGFKDADTTVKGAKDVNLLKITDSQILAKSNSESNAAQNSTLILKSKSEFVDGECGTISSNTKPKVILLHDDFLISEGKSCRIFAEILNKLILQTIEGISFICNDLNELACISYALELSKFPYITYAPLLLGNLPSSKEKLEIKNKLNTFGCHLITDYRACRGCEFKHCVIFINPNEEFVNHAFIEMITRTISKLDIFVYPAIKRKEKETYFFERFWAAIMKIFFIREEEEETLCLSKILTAWENEDIDKIAITATIEKHKCIIHIDGEQHRLRFTTNELNKFREKKQEQLRSNKKDTHK